LIQHDTFGVLKEFTKVHFNSGVFGNVETIIISYLLALCILRNLITSVKEQFISKFVHQRLSYSSFNSPETTTHSFSLPSLPAIAQNRGYQLEIIL